MKNFILKITFVFISISNPVIAQWQWAKQIGGPDYDGGGIIIDANSNVYCTGSFETECYFDSDTLYSSGFNDIFLAKFDANGNEQWSKRIGSNNPVNYDEYPSGFVVDNNNNCIYLGGRFYNNLTIDAQSITGWGIFLAKFNFSGTCQWLRKAGSISVDDRSMAVAISSDGNIYWSGLLDSNGTVNSVAVDKGTFLAKFDPSGNTLWARNEITDGDITGLIVKDNEIYIAGTTRNDTTIVDTIPLIAPGTSAINTFIAKLDTSGNVAWAKRYGGPFEVYGSGIELDVSDNIYIVGRFTDSLIVEQDSLSNAGNRDMYFAKFDNNGNLVWINQSHANGISGAAADGIVNDIDGKFYLVGRFSGNATFGTFNITASIVEDMFVARYDDTGLCIGIRHFGRAQGYGIQSNSVGEVFVSGIFVNTCNIGSTSLTSHGNYDMFFAKSDAITGVGEGEGEGRVANNTLIIYANPNAGKCNITVPDDFLHEKKLTLSIYDNTGRLIQQKTLEMNDGKIKLNLEAEAKGVYNVTLSNRKKSYNGKIVFE